LGSTAQGSALTTEMVGVADPLKRCPSPRVSVPSLFVKRCGMSTMKICGKKIDPCVCLSTSPKIIRTHKDRSDTDFPLTFHISHVSISYRFQDKQRFQSIIVNFSQPHIHCVPKKTVVPNFGNNFVKS